MFKIIPDHVLGFLYAYPELLARNELEHGQQNYKVQTIIIVSSFKYLWNINFEDEGYRYLAVHVSESKHNPAMCSTTILVL